MVRVGLSTLLFAWALGHVGWGRVLGELRELSTLTLAVAMGIAGTGVILTTGKWAVILCAQGFQVPFRRLTRIYFISWFFSIAMTGGAGGYVYRAWALSRDTKSAGIAGASLVLDRISDLLGATLLAIAGLGITAPVLGVWRVTVGAAMLTALFGLAGYVVLGNGSRHLLGGSHVLRTAWGSRLQRVMDEFVVSARAAGRSGFLWARVLLLSLAFQLMSIFLNHTIASLQGWEVSWRYFFAFIPLVGLVSLLPLTVNGIGLTQWVYVLLFAEVGLGPHRAVLLSLLILAITVIWALVGGILYAFTAESSASHRASLRSPV